MIFIRYKSTCSIIPKTDLKDHINNKAKLWYNRGFHNVQRRCHFFLQLNKKYPLVPNRQPEIGREVPKNAYCSLIDLVTSVSSQLNGHQIDSFRPMHLKASKNKWNSQSLYISSDSEVLYTWVDYLDDSFVFILYLRLRCIISNESSYCLMRWIEWMNWYWIRGIGFSSNENMYIYI